MPTAHSPLTTDHWTLDTAYSEVTIVGMLLFKKKFLPAIRSREKTQTIRLWKHRMMRNGQRSYIPGAGYITIDSVQEVKIDELTDDDAIPDVFPTAVALRAELDSLYADKIAAGYKAFRVVFHLQEPPNE